MSYIVNPMVFYWIGLFGKIHALSVVSSICFIFILIGFIVYYCELTTVRWKDEEDVLKINIAKKRVKISLICMIASLTILVFSPSEVTMYKMLIASQVTVENVDLAKTGVTDLVDYIVEKVDEMQQEDK